MLRAWPLSNELPSQLLVVGDGLGVGTREMDSAGVIDDSVLAEVTGLANGAKESVFVTCGTPVEIAIVVSALLIMSVAS